jgi:hypothetical protein
MDGNKTHEIMAYFKNIPQILQALLGTTRRQSLARKSLQEFFSSPNFMREVKREFFLGAFALKNLDKRKHGTFLNGNLRGKDSNA